MGDIIAIKCPACAEKRIHTQEETDKFHPLAGHGFTSEQGPTYPSIEDRRKKK